jgi:hypothetical protein
VTTFSTDDRNAILELIANYAYTWDGKDAEGHCLLFIDDAIWELYREGESTPESRTRTRAERRQRAVESFAGRLAGVQTRHHQSSTIFTEIESDTVKGKTMVLVTHQRADETTPRLMFSGVYNDTFVRTAAGWKFARRVGYIVGPHTQSKVTVMAPSGSSAQQQP